MNTLKLKEVTITLRGISKLIMHNGRLADDSDELTLARKAAQDAHKKNPTKENWERFTKAMMAGALYFTEEIGAFIPEDNLRAMLIKAGASITKKGMKTFKSAASTINFECDYGFPILVDGKPVKDYDDLLSNERWRFQKLVVINRNRVRNVRPAFPTGWTCDIRISYLPDIIDADSIHNIFEIAGMEVGLGDWRPSSPKPGPFGRFLVTKFAEDN
jgi:hypothetical protein